MKIKTIHAEYGRKWSTGDYGSMTVNASVWADLDEGEDAKKALDSLYALCKEEVKTQAMPVLKTVSAKTADVFQGLPIKEGEGK